MSLDAASTPPVRGSRSCTAIGPPPGDPSAVHSDVPPAEAATLTKPPAPAPVTAGTLRARVAVAGSIAISERLPATQIRPPAYAVTSEPQPGRSGRRTVCRTRSVAGLSATSDGAGAPFAGWPRTTHNSPAPKVIPATCVTWVDGPTCPVAGSTRVITVPGSPPEVNSVPFAASTCQARPGTRIRRSTVRRASSGAGASGCRALALALAAAGGRTSGPNWPGRARWEAAEPHATSADAAVTAAIAHAAADQTVLCGPRRSMPETHLSTFDGVPAFMVAGYFRKDPRHG